MPKLPYKARGHPATNPARLRRERAYARGADKHGTAPNAPWRKAAGRRPGSNLEADR